MSDRQKKDVNVSRIESGRGRSGSGQRSRTACMLDHQRSMVRKAAEEGMSNLIVIALETDPSINPTQLAAPRGLDDVPLVTACVNGHLDVVRNLIETCHISLDCRADVTLDDKEIKGTTPLWAASYSGNLDLVKYLVQKGASVNLGTDTNSSPLRVAAYEGHTAVVQFLLEKGADVNSVNNHGHSVLMVACFRNHPDVVKILLDHGGVNVNYATPDSATCFIGETALHVCAKKGNTDNLKMLLAHGATINRGYNNTTALLIAALEGHDDFVNYHLGIPDVSRDDRADALEVLGTAHWASKESRAMDECLSLWQRAMEERHRPGRLVVKKREMEKLAVYGYATECQTMAELKLLSASRDTQAVGLQCMLIRERILGKEHSETCFIIRYNAAVFADDDRFDRSVKLLLHLLDNLALARPFSQEIVKAFGNLTTYLAYDKEMSHGVTVSHILTSLKRLASELQRGEAQLKELQKDSALITNRHNLLKMALHLICVLARAAKRASSEEKGEFKKAVVSLVQRGFRDPKKNTLLHMACDKGTTEGSEDSDLFDGCQFPAAEVVNVLLEAGCDVAARNEAGKTALQVAQEQDGDQGEIIKMLLSAGVATVKVK